VPSLFNWATQVGFEIEGLSLIVFAGLALAARDGVGATGPVKIIAVLAAVAIQAILPMLGHAAVLKVLRVLLGYAVSIDMIDSNPAISVKKYKGGGEGFHSWSEAEIVQFEERHPIGSRARLAMALLLYTAQRRGDVVGMGWQQLRGDTITLRQEKTDTPLAIPVHPELAMVLASTPRSNLTFLTTERGAPFTSAGFGNWFRDRCNEAGLPQCSAHGLRKAAATRLANAGCSSDQIRAITGHRSLSEVAHYTRSADQQRLARQAMAMQIGAESEQELSNLPNPVGQNGR
jgi:integrase